jgi:two-component system response regulator YesN
MDLMASRLIRTKPEIKVKELAEVLSFGEEYTGCSPTGYKEQVRLETKGILQI